MAFPRGEKGDRAVKWFALAISIAAFIASLHLPYYFESAKAGFQFAIDKVWMASPNIHYHLGVDGISLWLVVLTTFLVPFSIIIQWNSVHGRIKEFFILMLLLETAMLGVFVALDLFLFYVFWEATLIPMALIIGMYGHERRIYAAVKFFLYTMIASVFMLAAIIWLYVQYRQLRFHCDPQGTSSGHLRSLRRHRCCCSSDSSSPSPSRFRSSRCTPGCRTRTWKLPPPAPCCWQACC